jgi:DNA-binding MarR family transcriptional regulator
LHEEIATAGPDALTDAGLELLWALVGVADESLAATGTSVTLLQFRALMAVARAGTVSASGLAREVGVAPSTATRLCDRLVRARLVARGASPDDRRLVTLSLTARGIDVVDRVVGWRRAELARRLASVDPSRRDELAAALAACAHALGGAVLSGAAGREAGS